MRRGPDRDGGGKPNNLRHPPPEKRKGALSIANKRKDVGHREGKEIKVKGLKGEPSPGKKVN